MLNKRKPWQTVVLYIFIFILCVIVLYPYFTMFITSLKYGTEMYSIERILPEIWNWKNYLEIWKQAPVFRYFLNSLIVAGGSTAIAIICGIPAAYALCRFRFKGKGLFLGIVIMSQMFSPVVLLVGIYRLMSNMGLVDNIVALVLLNAAFNQAFAVWLLRGTFSSISPDMEQAAKLDGCTTVGSMFRILIPMAAPGIITALIFTFINAWNEYTIALTLMSTDVLKPITTGINVFYGFNFIQWQYLFATSLIATVPVIILFLCIEKHLTSGLTAGGVKG